VSKWRGEAIFRVKKKPTPKKKQKKKKKKKKKRFDQIKEVAVLGENPGVEKEATMRRVSSEGRG